MLATYSANQTVRGNVGIGEISKGYLKFYWSVGKIRVALVHIL